jgi:AcrR family transcriptional regulator
VSRTREDLVTVALRLLDTHGLADVSMRRVAGELGLQPSALYHHVPSKQVLLGAVADEVLRRGARPRRATAWDERVAEVAHELRDAMLAYRDGAELVSAVIAFGLGAARPLADLTAALSEAGLPEVLVPTAARTVLHFVLGHTLEEQTHLQAGSAGAIDDDPRPSDFAAGLGIVVDGLRVAARRGLSATR